MRSFENFIEQKLAERQSAGIYRTLKPENLLIDFCSNDYLGFARSSALKEKITTEVNQYPDSMNGSAGSRLLAGNLTYTETLEKVIAAWHNSETGLLFNSGYDANVGLFSSLPQRGDTIILDELIHASVIDGARLSHANRYTFKHNDLQSLEDKLKQAKGNCYVGIESVYSMDGDTPPIKEIIEITERYNAALIVDEAHAVGLYNKGIVVEQGLQDKVFAQIVTFGKALGCHGAIVLGSNKLREYLINFARSFIYTTAASFHQLASVKIAYEFLQGADSEIESLQNNIAAFKQGVQHNPAYPLLVSDSPIQCLVLNSNEKAREVAAALQAAGMDIRPIFSPTVPQGSERIRICLHSYNTIEDIALLTNTINTLLHG
ncbi:pyridoxal phosphate-dependent aminotransferase family protein [Mucilaginibacter gynuensis]|uniref:Pyridoxal phosphate-dependent aminotransferase family protein n=1 Tax=Mucilaginibacter gynuensis TaxID=1302236 RepID=A0ABP8H2Q1_9SPHI